MGKGGGWGGKPWQGLVWEGPTYGHKGYTYGYDDSYGYGSDYGYGNKMYGYDYYAELPGHRGVRYLRYSKPTGFLYSPGRYIGHSAPYIPYTEKYKYVVKDDYYKY